MKVAAFRDVINRGLAELGESHRWCTTGAQYRPPEAKRPHFVESKPEADRSLDHRERQAARGLHHWEDSARPTHERVESFLAPLQARRRQVRPNRAVLEEQERREAAHARSALGEVGDSVSPRVVPPGEVCPSGIDHYPRTLRPEGWRPGELEPTTPTQRACPRVLRPEWVPKEPKKAIDFRRTTWRMRRALRPLGRVTSNDGLHSRIAACGVLPTAEGGISVVMNPETGRAGFRGLQHCGSVWECPVCRAKVAAERAAEIRQVVEGYWSPERAGMFTVTIRHAAGMSLRELRRGLAHAWRLFCQGKTWLRFKAATGLHGGVRALEVTHGPKNGWHPHLHGVWLFHGEQQWDERTDEWRHELYETMQKRWARCVRHAFNAVGERAARYYDTADDAAHVAEYHRRRGDRLAKQCEPDKRIGLKIKRCRRADYIAKLGLELTDPGSKKAKEGHETPTDIAYRWTTTKDPSAAKLWREWCEAMKGARQLTWTVGLKHAAAVAERTDAECAEDEERGASVVELGTLDLDEWKAVRNFPTKHGWPATLWILEQAEKKGAPGLRRALRIAIRRAS